MLKTTQIVKTASVRRLLEIWGERYRPDLPSLYSMQNDPSSYKKLVEAASPEGRAATATKLEDFLLEIKCQMAKLQTNNLYAYIPNIVDLNEAKQLAYFAFLVYKKLIDIYQSLPSTTLPKARTSTTVVNSRQSSLLGWEMPAIEELALALEPVILEFQAEHVASKDWRTLGFITTLLNFSSKLIPKKLTAPEQVLIQPYLKFIEEQVALPWERVCAAAAQYQVDNPTFRLVEQMLPASDEIAQVVYRRLIQMLPNHCSRRGKLNEPGISHSCLRDLEMFQAYLWLCVLEESLVPIEQELVTLCAMVLPSVEVKWEMTELWNNVLADEILVRVSPSQKIILLPYTHGLQQAFLKNRDRFSTTLKHHQLTDDYLKDLNIPQSRRRYYLPAEYRQNFDSTEENKGDRT